MTMISGVDDKIKDEHVDGDDDDNDEHNVGDNDEQEVGDSEYDDETVMTMMHDTIRQNKTRCSLFCPQRQHYYFLIMKCYLPLIR